ncbi:MAG: DUF1015 domain-containing protein [Dehalococcoidales bacterium]|nr:DUF1015 domain-containing protein [Dehalococcoidales bacterium]
MAEIRPFRGVHYNESLVPDWSDVICPPYDIISPQQQEQLYEKSDYNYVRIESGRELPQDTANDNRYTRSAGTFRKWLEQDVFKTDDTPSLYLHDHYFTWRGVEYKRRNLFARVRLEEWDEMVVRPHEGTLSGARGDRLSLLYSIEANTSPILVMYQDSGGQVTSLLKEQSGREPLMKTSGENGERHEFWVINKQDVIRKICKVFEGRPLYIADGHHRYESALAYRNEKAALSEKHTGDEPYNFVMMSLVEFSDPGLMILAPHRLVRGIPRSNIDELYSNASKFFDIEKMPLKAPDVWLQVEDLLKYSKKLRIVLFGIDTDNLYILTLHDTEKVGTMMPYFHSEMYRKLDVSIVDHVILENLLALSGEKEKDSLAFVYDMTDAVRRVMNQEYQLALLLSPVNPEMIKAISDARDKMPRKSTYFYPKTPSGLVINRLDTE